MAPGQSNADQLAGPRGDWTKGFVRGHLVQSGWGADEVYPGLTLDPTGPKVAVQIFESPDLPNHWERLDAFEGADYRRVEVEVILDSGATKRAMIYSVSKP